MPTWCKWALGFVAGFIALKILANIALAFEPVPTSKIEHYRLNF